jgi:low affinity Fe/Cu permease
MQLNKAFSRTANLVATAAGRPATFVLCVAIIVVWGITGPIFGFSDTWQLVINTGTTIVTFLMVFLIQNTQNRETSAMQAKLDEIILALSGAQNRMIGIEHLTDTELEEIVAECERRALIPPQQRHPRTGERIATTAAKARRKPARAPG